MLESNSKFFPRIFSSFEDFDSLSTNANKFDLKENLSYDFFPK